MSALPDTIPFSLASVLGSVLVTTLGAAFLEIRRLNTLILSRADQALDDAKEGSRVLAASNKAVAELARALTSRRRARSDPPTDDDSNREPYTPRR